MKDFKCLIILIGIFNYVLLIQAQELLELNCSNAKQCKQFQHSGINSSCIEEQCVCTSYDGKPVECQPFDTKVNNIIGGPCPCKQPNAECIMPQGACYCKIEFMPSIDNRRCISETVPLGEKCEQTSQCQMADFNSICHDESQQCKCMDKFVRYEGECVSIVGSKALAWNDTQCEKEYGDHTKYNHEHQHCICKPGHFASVNNSCCLKTAKYNENCEEDLQCLGTMGLGGECIKYKCQCSAQYFPEEHMTEEGTNLTVCTAVVKRADYCRSQEDCYQHQLNETEQTMDCIYGECDCKMDFHSYNGGDCTKGSGAGIVFIMEMPSVIIISIFIYKYFS